MKRRFLILTLLAAVVTTSCTKGDDILDTPNEYLSNSDPNFKKYLLENFDTNGNGSISDEKVLAVTSIDCSSMKISSLDGIGQFVNLTE